MLKTIKGGIEAVVEDWPGRLGYMGLGMAPSGAMDNYALQLANLLVGNEPGEAGLEIAAGYCEFEIMAEGLLAIGGADMGASLNGRPLPLWESFAVKAGDSLKYGHFQGLGFRSYLAVQGGLDVPVYLGSKSTCLFGSYGGFEGRKLQAGDVLNAGSAAAKVRPGRRVKAKYLPQYTRDWEIRVITGPNSAPDYVTEEGMDFLFSGPKKISHNANRSAYRLEEFPDSFFARKDGGDGGSHPSNIVDHGYNMRGAIDMTGNTPCLLTADGPTLGGFICVGNVINADLWKIGQGVPARDSITFIPCSMEEATAARLEHQGLLRAADLII